MKTDRIVPATWALDARGLPWSAAYGDIYHPAAGAPAQARHVFLAGNGLPARWAGRERFVVAETGFGLGNNFLAAWHAWRADPQRCRRLVFVSVERHPFAADDLARAHAASPWPDLAAALVAAWPPPTPNLHVLDFDDGRVQLLLGLGDVAVLLPQLLAAVDAWCLDGFAPQRNPAMWEPRVLKQLGRLAAPDATAATWSVAATVRAGLTTAGFEVRTAPGTGGKREITVARHAPRHRPAPLPGGLHQHDGPRAALVVGAGLAGCAAAWALARDGWQVQVLDRAAAVAAETSGNPAGLFHGAVHRDDGPHARLHRAAALRTQQVLAPWLADGMVRGQCAGVLRLDPSPDADATRSPAHAAAIDVAGAQARSGLAVPTGGWWFAGGGWVDPRQYAQALLARSGAALRGADIARIARRDGHWHALGADGDSIAHAPVLVLANALGAPRLAATAGAAPLGALQAVRGQITGLVADGLPSPAVPVAGLGYVLPAIDGRLWLGATAHDGDLTAAPRADDDRHNLAQFAALSGLPSVGDAPLATAAARVGWRAVTPDRLPLVGALVDPVALAQATHADRPRLVPRLRDPSGGLYVLGGLGARGITWAALCGELLASWVGGGPCPLEADLRDALDPARAVLRQR